MVATGLVTETTGTRIQSEQTTADRKICGECPEGTKCGKAVTDGWIDRTWTYRSKARLAPH